MLPEKKSRDLIVFDLDGTLVHNHPNGNRGVPLHLQKTLQELQERADIVVATGRRYRSAQTALRELPAMDFSITHNGLIVRDAQGQVLVRESLERELALHTIGEFEANLWESVFVMDGELRAVDFAHPYMNRPMEALKNRVELRGREGLLALEGPHSLPSEFDPHLLEVATIGPYEDLLGLRESLQKKVAGELRVQVVKNAGYSGLSVMEVFLQRVSKWSGVEYVRKQLGAERVICIGDDENDIEMLKAADIGVVMSHAVPMVKDCGDVEVDGPEGLEEFLRGNYF